MSDEKRTVEKGQVYLSNEDKRRGTTRTVTIERTVRAKRVYDTKKQLYAVAVSRIVEHPRADQVGKKRRVFLKVARLLSSEYTMIADLTTTPASTPPIDLGAAGLPTETQPPVNPPTDSFGAALPFPVPCGEAS